MEETSLNLVAIAIFSMVLGVLVLPLLDVSPALPAIGWSRRHLEYLSRDWHSIPKTGDSGAIPESGLVLYLKEFVWVKVFCQDFNNEARYCIMFQPVLEVLTALTREQFKQVHDYHWQIESFHRVIKQVCNIERFQVRNEQAIRNHFFCSLSAFCKL